MTFPARAGQSLLLATACCSLALFAPAQSPEAPFTADSAHRLGTTDVFGPSVEDYLSAAVGAPVSFASPVPVTHAAPRTPPLPAGQNVLLADYLRAPTIDDQTGLRRLAENFDLLVLHEWHSSKIPLFRQTNPDIVILLYKTRGLMLSDSQEGVENYNNVKQYDFAFMHDASGNHIFWDWNLDGRMDVASPRPEVVAYQDFFYDRALASVSQGGFDGLLIDDVWSSEGVQNTPDAIEYSNANNSEALQAAMTSYLAAGYQRTRTTGQLLAANIGWWQQLTASGGRTGRRYMEQLDIAMQEKFFVNYTTHWNTGESWFTEINALIRDMRETGRTLICHTRGDTADQLTMLYALGSYLCLTDRDGRAALSHLDQRSSSRIPPIYPEYDLAEELGAPVYDVRWHSGHGCGYRRFANGYVVVNPNSTSRTIPELAGLYDVYGVRVPSSGFRLPGHSAMLFFDSPVQR
ncbi:hypothetical protein JXA47_00495 [Candidatus Sumerlaeota bacterium]|nr:hypothetical protein [Candidatus Sumerlaeota bacterium]